MKETIKIKFFREFDTLDEDTNFSASMRNIISNICNLLDTYLTCKTEKQKRVKLSNSVMEEFHGNYVNKYTLLT